MREIYVQTPVQLNPNAKEEWCRRKIFSGAAQLCCFLWPCF